MIRHIVFFKMKEGTGPEERDGLISELSGLKAAIPLVKELEVGEDVGRGGKSYDVVLNSTFDSIEDVATYAAHEAHVKVLGYIDSVCEGIVKVDYEI